MRCVLCLFLICLFGLFQLFVDCSLTRSLGIVALELAFGYVSSLLSVVHLCLTMRSITVRLCLHSHPPYYHDAPLKVMMNLIKLPPPTADVYKKPVCACSSLCACVCVVCADCYRYRHVRTISRKSSKLLLLSVCNATPNSGLVFRWLLVCVLAFRLLFYLLNIDTFG